MYLFFSIVAVFLVLLWRERTWYESAVYGLAVGMGLSALDHLLFCDWYVSVMSEWIPRRRLIVHVSAAVRLTLAVLLLFTRTQHAALLISLVMMIVVSQVNWRLAFHGHEIPAAAAISAPWRIARLVLHGFWVGWIIFTLELLRVVLRERREQQEAERQRKLLLGLAPHRSDAPLGMESGAKRQVGQD